MGRERTSFGSLRGSPQDDRRGSRGLVADLRMRNEWLREKIHPRESGRHAL